MKRILLYVLIAGVFFTFLNVRENTHLVDSNHVSPDKGIGHTKPKEPRKDNPERFTEYLSSIRTKYGESAPGYDYGYKLKELNKARKMAKTAQAKARTTESNLTFVERGPGNVPGRTRAMLVDPDDVSGNTWYGGSVGGGIWKTTDGGTTWINLTQDLPNLATSTLVMCDANHDILYAGTGEGVAGTGAIDGAGIFKSTDRGVTWTQLESTMDPGTFGRSVTRIINDPEDPDVLLASTVSSSHEPAATRRSRIVRSTNGGATWTVVYEHPNPIQDLTYDQSDFSTQYAGVNSVGAIKSTDGGQTWSLSNNGMNPSGRVELTISPVNTNRLYASTEGGLTATGSDLYVTDNAGASWNAVRDINGNNVHFLGGQGWYDNCVVAHPFNRDIVYVGGVNLFRYTVTPETIESNGVSDVEENNTETFLGVVDFGAPYFGGGLDISEDASNRTYVSVQIRFGPNRSQKAHRFHVPAGRGSGVDDSEYQYQNYVDVPFEVWDIDNNRQLMVSFRDQGRNGRFDLIESNTGGDPTNQSREYVFISQEDYDPVNPSSTIASTGGHVVSDLFFLWPVLAPGASSDPSRWPQSELTINWASRLFRLGETLNIADAYGDFQGINSFTNEEFVNNEGIHPDHHDFELIIDDESAQRFRILNSTDGGIYVSNSSQNPGINDGEWYFAGSGYNTSQFYGADKAPGQDRYIGGMQDNSTFFTPEGSVGSASTSYQFAIGGDGFETLWHSSEPNKMIGSIYNNLFYRSIDGGVTWELATSGLFGGGPFVSRLANSMENPDRLYAVGTAGVWISENFGKSWLVSPIYGNWSGVGSTQPEVSLANHQTIWAGGGMSQNDNIFVSTDNGLSFNPVNNYTTQTLGRISGFATHPTEENTAYALFSFAQSPKILKTIDLGQTWEDISGFEGNTVSDNGFPDVAVLSLLVHPNDTDRIWAGTEIGIVESLDGGNSWSLLESNFPAVSTWQMMVRDDQVVIATHGRGIWSVTLEGIEPAERVVTPNIELAAETPEEELMVLAYLYSPYDKVEVLFGDDVVEVLTEPAVGQQTIKIPNLNIYEKRPVKIVAHVDGMEYPSNTYQVNFFKAPLSESYVNEFDTSSEEDFLGDKMIFRKNVDGFEGGAIHSPHPYINGQTHTYQLKVPITIARANSIFYYEDIALVEPGAEGVAYGESGFWDYVVVEGTKDGVNWVPLENGYDASLAGEWTVKFNNNTDPTSLDYRAHYIDLLNTFETGDNVFFRFRLFADDLTNGWGWVIDNIRIQEFAITNLNDDILNQPTIRNYPNPVQLNTTIEFYIPQRGQASLEMMDMNGRVIFENNLGIRDRGLNSIEWSRTGLEQGIYILKIHTLNGAATTRVQLN